jgi:hypothetical protein
LDGKRRLVLRNFDIDVIVEVMNCLSNSIGIVEHSKFNLILNFYWDPGQLNIGIRINSIFGSGSTQYWDPGQLNIAVRLLAGTVGESIPDFESEQK